MKRWLIIIGAVLLAVVLVMDWIYNGINNYKAERQWYLKQLGFNFSAKIDSIKPHSHKGHAYLFFHITDGVFDRFAEARLNTKLNYNGKLDLLTPHPGNQFEIYTDRAQQIVKGDIMHVNTVTDIISFRRNGQEIAWSRTSASLRGSPFKFF